ncbi:MAG: histidine phosphatase family protein [Myxococcota bacterium]|nr:histidine phosphatase family protein [Myxococcota bacterium]
MPVRQILLVRHGETDGESSIRYHGSTDLELSDSGREQMRRLGAQLARDAFDLVVASPLKRSWRAAWLVGGGRPVRLESDLREIHFGRWEGLTREEIEARDPVLYEDWQKGAEGFEFPGGEARESFRERVGRGLERILAADASSVLAVLHKGVIREIVRRLTGEELDGEAPEVGELVWVTRLPDGTWFLGKRSSDPPPLREAERELERPARPA